MKRVDNGEKTRRGNNKHQSLRASWDLGYLLFTEDFSFSRYALLEVYNQTDAVVISPLLGLELCTLHMG